nr:TfoX/Sxy family protein [uncultured Allomuricauda sp.]
MGVKGAKITQGSVLAAELIVQKLSSISDISAKKMFGGHGIFHTGKMFGIIHSKGTAYLKVDISNQKDYEKNGARKHGKMPYYSIPDAVFDDVDTLLLWAKKSIEISKK